MSNSINEFIQNRRSVYPSQYTGEKVKREIIEQMLKNATFAPTHRLTQPWRFLVFENKALEKLLEKMAEIYKNETPPEHFKEEKYHKFADLAFSVSHIIAIGMKRHAQLVPEIEEICAVACAVQNMQLTACAYGVGVYWSTGGGTFSDAMQEFLGFDKCLGFLYVGMPKNQFPMQPRKPVEQISLWIDE